MSEQKKETKIEDLSKTGQVKDEVAEAVKGGVGGGGFQEGMTAYTSGGGAVDYIADPKPLPKTK